ncbi:MAG: ATP-binding protein [Actinomycetia bacterium]|nr:ATP-binding protein [Actinomycetes bacterium]
MSTIATPTELELVIERVRLLTALRFAWLAERSVDHEGRRRGDDEVNLGDLDHPADEADWRHQMAPKEVGERLAEVDELLKAETIADRPARLRVLTHMFGLSPIEVDIVHACVAASLDPGLARQFAALHHDTTLRAPSEPVVARVFSHGRTPLWTAESPLRTWSIVAESDTDAGPSTLRLDPHILAWLHGVDELHTDLVGRAAIHPPENPLEAWHFAEVAERFRPSAPNEAVDPLRFCIRGPMGSGRRTFAACVAEQLGLPLLVVDADRVEPAAWPRTFHLAQRQAFLDGCALAFVGDATIEQPWPIRGALFPVQFVIAGRGDHPVPAPELRDEGVDIAGPTVAERHELWARYCPGSVDWPEPGRSDVVERPHTVVGDIGRVGRRAPESPEEAAALLRSMTSGRVGTLVVSLETPYAMDDLVVPDRERALLDTLLFEARDRRTLWESPGAHRMLGSPGVVALFAGEPGLGKTMAAQIVAAELGLELLRVNAAETISKYIGETSKNLDLLLRQTQDLDVVLLFDEADTMFSRRTDVKDAHDRFANTDTNFLLQAIEQYPGIAILATNRRDQIDDAFTRRVRYIVEFPRPDAPARLELWTKMLGAVAGPKTTGRLGPTLAALADHVDTTGAEIKHAVLNATFIARRIGAQIGPDQLLLGLDQELAKEGRSLSERERSRMLAHA